MLHEVELNFHECFKLDKEGMLHLWLPWKIAQDMARKLVNKNVSFEYYPQPGNESVVEVICNIEDTKDVLKMKVIV